MEAQIPFGNDNKNNDNKSRDCLGGEEFSVGCEVTLY